MDEQVKTKIEELIKSKKVFLFMKGTPEEPDCGFSARVIEVLNHFNIEYLSFDILENEEIRQGIKEYSNWPTIPQLYIDGKFVGGCDIIEEMARSGELSKLLN
ncbi:Grx4 family monothiol glutaredoxin [Candidatus Woesearchaeota archaeon]|jgi:monothiol glutaredoxin|nr:Grx4 family monothiol glutaredoxin [Candidatus Woesearchaeota archaeon]MBT4387095.1 Grx4 family monothiol glutaredoxin [Candidatus Woesearchaeota archaeon]MBT4596148.1 Grx4 family monothiol glutaredoxin [Candidatus Woesearchaeota archaeon]MBT5741629.1 Grx4 family monothiol glutaredoxin [Candidatus Woesearchaeota archaeon]MBT6505650.1 Grx4 family monothiol glutaredoxin [Candidatus Woesearchaeota archaeon]